MTSTPIRRSIATVTLMLALCVVSLSGQRVRLNGVAVGGSGCGNPCSASSGFTDGTNFLIVGGATGLGNGALVRDTANSADAPLKASALVSSGESYLSGGTTSLHIKLGLNNDIGMARTAAGVMEVNSNGPVSGVFRDIVARNYLWNANAVNGLQSTVPTISAGCGSGAAIAGKASAFQVTIGTTPGTCVVNFNVTWANTPICIAEDRTTGNLVRCQPSTTQATLAGTLTASDIIYVLSIGY